MDTLRRLLLVIFMLAPSVAFGQACGALVSCPMATTPLGANDLFMVVQGGLTKQVPFSAVSIVPTLGAGVEFALSQTLNSLTSSSSLIAADDGVLPSGLMLPGPLVTGDLLTNGVADNGPLSSKMSAAGQATVSFFENYSTSDESYYGGAFPYNTPAWADLEDKYQGTRGVNHGNASYAGDGNGPVLDFKSWSRRGSYLDSFGINCGLVSAAANDEESLCDFNGYLNGTITTLFTINAQTTSVEPGGTNGVMNLGDDTSLGAGHINAHWNDAWFGGTLTTTTGVVTGNLFVGGAAVLHLEIVSSLPTCNSGTEGWMFGVTDATSTTFNATLAGSGSNHVIAYCNSANWTVH